MAPSFGQSLKTYRKRCDLTQEALAEMVGCAAESIRKMEADRQRPSRHLAELIARRLSLRPDELEGFVQLARARTGLVSPGAFPASASSQGYGLPGQATSLVGRAGEIAAICALLRSPTIRLVTLTGPGGVGKTRLSIQVATELLESFADGVYFVDLTAVHKPGLVAASIANALRLQGVGERLLMKHISAFLHNKHLLLVLDNFEHLVSSAPIVGDLLKSLPSLRILTTSRALLHLYGEYEFVVPPLAVPNLKDLPGKDLLGEYDSVRIFVERAQAIKHDFRLTASNARAIAEICVRLEGLPLAIELAAAHSKMLSPANILARLEDRFSLLATEASNLPGRHLALRQTIGWSYDLLTEEERMLFRRLGVFSGGFSFQAAETICAEAASPPGKFYNTLASLLDKSLLQQTVGIDGENRFSMLEMIRVYALERLDEQGETHAIRDKYLAYYIKLAEQTTPRSIGLSRWGYLGPLGPERENLRAATQWALEQGRGEVVVQMCSALVHFWYIFGQPGELRQWLEATLPLSLPAQTRAKALALIGYVLAFMQIDYFAAQGFYEQAILAWRALGDVRQVSDLLCQLGTLMMERGEYTRAQALHEESLVLCKTLGDREMEMGIRECLAILLLRQGDVEQAESIFVESLQWWQLRQEVLAMGLACLYLGIAAMYRGEYERARSMDEQALSIWENAGDTRGVSAALNALGPVALYQGRADEAKSMLQQSLKLRWDCQDYDGIASNLERLAEVAIAQGSLERAARLWGSAEALREGIKSFLPTVERTRYEGSLAEARATLGESAWALAYFAGRAMPIEQMIAFALDG